MTTSVLGSTRGTEHGETTLGAGGAITPDVSLTYEDVLTRDELMIEVEKLRSFIIEMDFPRV